MDVRAERKVYEAILAKIDPQEQYIGRAYSMENLLDFVAYHRGALQVYKNPAIRVAQDFPRFRAVVVWEDETQSWHPSLAMFPEGKDESKRKVFHVLSPKGSPAGVIEVPSDHVMEKRYGTSQRWALLVYLTMRFVRRCNEIVSPDEVLTAERLEELANDPWLDTTARTMLQLGKKFEKIAREEIPLALVDYRTPYARPAYAAWLTQSLNRLECNEQRTKGGEVKQSAGYEGPGAVAV